MTRAPEKVFVDDVTPEAVVQDVVFVALCSSGARNVVRSDARPLVTLGMANAGVVGAAVKLSNESLAAS